MSLAYPKPERIESPEYRKFVRQHKCVVDACWRAVSAHHVVFEGQGRMSSKVPDFQCLPLCQRHHDEMHAHGRTTFELKHGVDFAQIIIELLSLYIRQLLDSGLEAQ